MARRHPRPRPRAGGAVIPPIAPNNAGAAALHDRNLEGPVGPLNLLRSRTRADHGHAPHLAPDTPEIGRDAYARYEAWIGPRRAASGGEVMFSGRAGAWFIGPEDEHRDHARLLRHASVARFLAFAQDRAAQDLGHHRTAALSDSPVLPLAPAQPANT